MILSGQHDTYLHISGADNIVNAVNRCNASLFTDRAIAYRIDKGFDHFKVSLSAGVMVMVRSDKASAGVMFSLDTESGCRDVVFISGAYGLGENVVQGTVDTDEFHVHKPTFKKGYRCVLKHRIGKKQEKMIYSTSRFVHSPVQNVRTTPEEREAFCISDEQVLELADAAIKIEEHYGVPMDMEWAVDGKSGLLYIVQARPETVASQESKQKFTTFTIKGTSNVLCKGRAIGSKIHVGRARLIRSAQQISSFSEGEILVTDSTSPDWEPIMKSSGGVITNRGGRMCHAAILSREMGIAAVVGCSNATTSIKDGQLITISCAEGDEGKVYDGEVAFEERVIDVADLAKTKTEIMLNLGDPAVAFSASMLPSDGVGLARMEFIILNHLKAHPLALIHPEKLKSREARRRIMKLTKKFENGSDFMIHTLAEGIGTIAGAFYPRPVVVRLSDFKTNEYANLIGGEQFEPHEENPLLGFRGAARYIDPSFEEAFALECAAFKFVAEKMGLSNLIPMVPFCRTVQEADRVLQVMAKYGLERGKNGLKVYCMCEIPNNVVQVDEFCKRFDGMSIGSNDLTMATLCVDRDSEKLAVGFDERDPGVLRMLRWAVEGCKRNNTHSGICGQAPSDFPEIAEFLVKHGIDSMSLAPDVLISTALAVGKLEGMHKQ